MTKDEALKLALDALEDIFGKNKVDVTVINVIKEALAQPEQEPVAIGDIRALKHRIHELEGEVIGYKRILDAQPEQEPVAWADLRKEAQQIVESKFLWKKFIDGTPLSNDIACWMAEFAQQYATPPQRTWVGLTDDEIASLHYKLKVQLMGAYKTEDIYQVIEAKLKEKNT